MLQVIHMLCFPKMYATILLNFAIYKISRTSEQFYLTFWWLAFLRETIVVTSKIVPTMSSMYLFMSRLESGKSTYVSSFCRNDVTHLNLFRCKHKTCNSNTVLVVSVKLVVFNEKINLKKTLIKDFFLNRYNNK